MLRLSLTTNGAITLKEFIRIYRDPHAVYFVFEGLVEEGILDGRIRILKTANALEWVLNSNPENHINPIVVPVGSELILDNSAHAIAASSDVGGHRDEH